MKRCPSCSRYLPLAAFWRVHRDSEERQVWCKPCMRAYRWQRRDVERVQDRARLARRMWTSR